MLRSKECRKDLSSNKMDDACFCDRCVPLSDEPDRPSRTELVKLFVYPDYRYRKSSETKDEAAERVVHDYLVCIGKLPKPFKKDMFAQHCAIMKLDLQDAATFDATYIYTGEDVAASIVRACSDAQKVLLVMRGHGTAGRLAVTLPNGSSFTLTDVGKALGAARFLGNVFLVLNVCHAEGSDSDVPPIGLGDGAEFSWVVVGGAPPPLQPPLQPSLQTPKHDNFNCRDGGCRGAWPPYAAHVMRVVSRLVAERPTYSELVDRVDVLWVDERDPEQPAALWRGPPTIRMCNVKGDERIL